MKIDIYVDSNQKNSRNTEVMIDGHMIEGLVSMDITFELNQPQMLTLVIRADDMTMHNTNMMGSAFQQVFITKP